MPVIRIDNSNERELNKRKINEKESYNSVISRLVSSSVFIYATGKGVNKLKQVEE